MIWSQIKEIWVIFTYFTTAQVVGHVRGTQLKVNIYIWRFQG